MWTDCRFGDGASGYRRDKVVPGTGLLIITTIQWTAAASSHRQDIPNYGWRRGSRYKCGIYKRYLTALVSQIIFWKFPLILTFSRLMTYIYIYIYIHIYICRTAPLTYRCCILYIYSTNIRTEYFKHAAHSRFFPLQTAVYFIMLPFLVPVLFTF